MKKIGLSVLAIAFLTGCRETKKTEDVKDDLREKIEHVGDKIDTGMDKVREKLKDFRDTVKSKIHRATAPDTPR